MQLTDQISPREAKFLELEYQASQPYMSFVYPTREVGLDVNRRLLEKRACEFAPPHGQLVIDETGEAVGMIAWLTGAALQRARLRATMALAQVPLFRTDPEIGHRLRLASDALLKVDKDDYYLSRIAVDESQRKRGVGHWLMDLLKQNSSAAGARQIVLEVSSNLEDTIRFYRRHEFAEIERRRVVDEHSGRSLEYVHMSLMLGPRSQVV